MTKIDVCDRCGREDIVRESTDGYGDPRDLCVVCADKLDEQGGLA